MMCGESQESGQEDGSGLELALLARRCCASSGSSRARAPVRQRVDLILCALALGGQHVLDARVFLVEAELVRRLAVDQTACRRRRLDVLLGDGVQLDPAPEEIEDLCTRGRRLETAGLAVRA